MDVYWASGSPHAWRVMLGLLFKDMPYDDHLLSITDREHKNPAYMAINPRGKIPTLVDGDVVVAESLAILAYLDRVQPKHPLFGNSAVDVGRIWQKVLDIDHHLMAQVMPITRALHDGSWTAKKSALRERVAELRAELDRQELLCEQGPFNAVDCVMVPILASLRHAGQREGAEELGLVPLDWSRWSGLVLRFRGVRELEGFQRTWPPTWAEG